MCSTSSICRASSVSTRPSMRPFLTIRLFPVTIFSGPATGIIASACKAKFGNVIDQMFPIQEGLRRSLNRLNLIVFTAYQLQSLGGTPVDKKRSSDVRSAARLSARSTPYQYRGRAQAILHGLCDERHRRTSITRCSGRAKARAPARALCHERAQ